MSRIFSTLLRKRTTTNRRNRTGKQREVAEPARMGGDTQPESSVGAAVSNTIPLHSHPLRRL